MLKRKSKAGAEYSATYLKTVQAQLSCIFNHAVRLYELHSNPVQKAGPLGEHDSEEMQYWTKEEYLQFIPTLADKPYSYLAFEPLYWCGMRMGELRALTAGDFNFNKKTISITKSYQKIKSRDVITVPKTKKEFLDDPDFKKTSKTIVKQLVGIRLLLGVTEYRADVYYNAKTGERIHAAFPAGVMDDVNYNGSIKAFLFLLNNECCTSIDKSRKFLSDLTSGQLNISKGMINKLSKEFAQKSEQERKTMFANMLLSPILHTDCTNAKVNGKNAYVFICATPDGKAMYFAREKKGHEGVKGTVVEDYQGTLIHDHESTFFNYGSDYQECLAHVLRYLKDSMSNESDRTWNKRMHSLIREMIHYRNNLPSETDCSMEKIMEFESQYKEILYKAKEEYEYIPPNKYYKEGYNLYLRMKKYISNHLLFLYDYRIPTTNNEAERLRRGYKRKQVQAVSFQSQASIDYLCQCMSMLVMMRRNEELNVFNKVSGTFG